MRFGVEDSAPVTSTKDDSNGKSKTLSTANVNLGRFHPHIDYKIGTKEDVPRFVFCSILSAFQGTMAYDHQTFIDFDSFFM